MALTQEQLDQLEYQKEFQKVSNAGEAQRQRADLIRLAKEVLFENDKSKDLTDRGVTAEDIIDVASKLEVFLKQE